MATKLKIMADKLQDDFRELLAEAVKDKFGIEVDSEYSIIAMRLMTTRSDGRDFDEVGHSYIGAYSAGYGDALSLVRRCDAERR